MEENLLNFLSKYVTPNKMEIFREMISKRTRHITVVLEDLYQPQNTSAVMRTCDCFGVQDVHIIENRNAWEYFPDVERGSSKWLNIHRYNRNENNTADCIGRLREKGYQIVATSPYGKTNVVDINVDQPFALIFGTEKEGVSEYILDRADQVVHIPMYGFTESFNISVAAAIFLHTCRQKVEQSGIDWKLTPEDHIEVMTTWCQKALRHRDKYVKEFHERRRNEEW